MVSPENYAVLRFTILISVMLMPLGLYSLLRRRTRRSAARWIALAILFFVCARILNTPVLRESDVRIPWAGLELFNLAYLGTMTCTTVALVYCAITIAWIAGRDVPPGAPHVAATAIAAVLVVSFLSSNLSDRYYSYLPDAFDGSLSQSIYWGTTALVVLGVASVAVVLTVRIIPAVTGPVRLMMALVTASGAIATLFAVHIIVRVFLNHADPDLLPEWYMQHSREIAMYLILVIVPLLYLALLCPIMTRLVSRAERFTLLYRHRADWLESRSRPTRHTFDDLPVPLSAAACWRAAATPAATYRCLLEVELAATAAEP